MQKSDSQKSRDAAGDAAKLVQTLFIRHTARLRAYIWAFVPSHNQVDDILHAVFIRITENADSYDASCDFLPWALTIARHEVFAASRAEKRLPQALSPEVLELLYRQEPAIDADGDRVDALAKCLDQLAPRSRQAIQMRYGLAISPAEISRRLALRVESVYVTLSKARAFLKDCVRRRLRMAGAET